MIPQKISLNLDISSCANKIDVKRFQQVLEDERSFILLWQRLKTRDGMINEVVVDAEIRKEDEGTPSNVRVEAGELNNEPLHEFGFHEVHLVESKTLMNKVDASGIQ